MVTTEPSLVSHSPQEGLAPVRAQDPFTRRLGRYVLHDRIAAGGMATVHLGRLVGPAAFARTVAIKRLHPGLAEDLAAVRMLLDEARIAARLHHPNVAATLDVVIERDDAYVILEYVHGESLARLLRTETSTGRAPATIASAIVAGALRGLHAAHEARNERGEPLEIVHRDVSPQNILVGADGVPRLIDFGIAKARMRAQTTADGRLKGKLSYLAPEQIRGEHATRQSDTYAAGVVLWEALTGRRLFDGDCAGAITEQILIGWVDPPSKYDPELPEALDRVVLRALETEPGRRFESAEAMAAALELAVPPAPAAEVGAWVQSAANTTLGQREAILRRIEASEKSAQPARRGRSLPLTLVALFLVLAGAAFAGYRARTPASSTRPALALQTPSPAATPVPTARPALEAAPTPAAASSALAAAPRRTPPATKRSTPHQPPPKVALASDGDCDPPYTLNPEGIRIYKRHCLSK